MTTNINNLFATESNAGTNNGRGLTGTAQLTSIASDIAAKVIREMNDNIEEYADRIKKSQADNNTMDALVNEIYNLETVDIDFLKELSEETLDGMLKSQQSKRSRCKSKAMTMDNYKALMTGAIAENLIRMASGKEKSSGPRRHTGTIEYTIEQLQMLEADQEKLRKEIRNVQSKKSIMKSKADFDENDERYQQLLRVEQQLKDMRIGTTTEVVEVDTTKNKLNELLDGIDLGALHAKDSKELLASILNLVHDNDDTITE